MIDARENVKYFIFFHPLMLFGNLNSVNLPTQIVKVPKKCYELGINAYVVKPVNITDFYNTVKQVGIFWAMLNELPNDGGI